MKYLCIEVFYDEAMIGGFTADIGLILNFAEKKVEPRRKVRDLSKDLQDNLK